MQVHRSDTFPRLNKAFVTAGTFDGVHYGHRQILTRVAELARSQGGESVVITYWPHPRLVLFPEQTDLKLLTTIEEKTDLIGQFGIDHLLVIEFSRAFSNLSSEDFIRQILVEKINTKKLVIGYDHKFGRNREGSFDYLQANAHVYGFEVEEIPRQMIDEEAVSSTAVRQALQAGAIETAEHYLERPYRLKGVVVKGDQLGRKIGYPTANILLKEDYKLVPKDGVYAVRVRVADGLFNGMMNIGVRPTIGGNLKHTIEAHLFDFDRDIYGEPIDVQFITRLRDEQKFNGLPELQAQLARDKQSAIARLAP